MEEPNGPNKSHYVLPMPDCFLYMTQKDRDNFFEFIPYRSISVGHMEGQEGLCLTVLSKEIQQERDEIAQSAKPRKNRRKDMER